MMTTRLVNAHRSSLNAYGLLSFFLSASRLTVLLLNRDGKKKSLKPSFQHQLVAACILLCSTLHGSQILLPSSSLEYTTATTKSMGNVLGAVAAKYSLQAQWGAADFAPSASIRDDAFCTIDVLRFVKDQRVEPYLRACLAALRNEELRAGPLQWRVPTSIVLQNRVFSKDEAESIGTLLKECCTELRGRVTHLSLQGHRELNAAALSMLLPKQRLSTLIQSSVLSALHDSLVVLDLSDCPFGDSGVKALSEHLFPTRPARKVRAAGPVASAAGRCNLSEAARHDDTQGVEYPTPSSMEGLSTHANGRVLPSLRLLRLDGVRLTDAGLEQLCVHLESVLRMATQEQRSHCASPPSCPALVPELSLARNDLSYRGIVRALRTTLARLSASASSLQPRWTAVGKVDVSWNSSAPLLISDSAGEESRLCFTSLGVDLVTALSSVDALQRAPPRPFLLLLRGCDLQPADTHALWVSGVLSTFLDRFREAGKAEMLRDLCSNVPHAEVPMLNLRCSAWTHLTRIDLSNSPAMGNRGVLSFLQTLLALEAARKATTSSRHPHGLVPHSLTLLEELSLRNVGCDDAVLPSAVHLLLGDDQLAASTLVNTVEGVKGGPQRSPLERPWVDGSGHGLAAVLREEAHAFAELRAQRAHGDPLRTTDSSAAQAVPRASFNTDAQGTCFWGLPYFKLLDLSANRFAAPTLIAAALSSAMIRAKFLHVGLGIVPGCTVSLTEQKGGGSPSVVADGCGAASFTLVMERCCVSDASLDAVPQLLRSATGALSAAHKAALSEPTGATSAVVPTSPTSVCALFLGGNELTHAAVVRLRHWAQQNNLREEQESAVSGSVIAYVEGNAVLYPSLRDGVVDDGDVVGGRGAKDNAADGGVLVLTSNRCPPSSLIDQPLFCVDAQARVNWNTLPSLPSHPTASSLRMAECVPRNSSCRQQQQQLHSPEVARAKSQFTVSAAPFSVLPQCRLAPPPSAQPNVHPENREVTGLDGNSSPTLSMDPEEYIDEFIAEAERVMSEHAYLMKSNVSRNGLSPAPTGSRQRGRTA
jgi:hypothetical protein